MPDHERRSLHRVCDCVSGVNWRPTRFVDELMLTRYACCVCHVIPNTTVVLPCFHALCEDCRAGCVIEHGGSLCPLDGKPFSGDECDSCHLSAKKKHNLKAHCWNEVHGCDFVGTLETILRHFEAECAFHAFPCQRCGESVPNTKLAAHYIGGCGNALSSAAQAGSPRQGGNTVVTASDVTAAGREIGTSVRYTCEDEVTVLQSQVNERAEAAGMQSATLASSIEALSANVTLAAEKLSELFGEHSQLQQRLLAGVAGESREAGEGGATDAASSSGGSTRSRQGTDLLRNLEHLACESVMCLRSLLQVAKGDN
ncbi:TNF receptor-associated factor 6-like [Dermacentor albipictus]|uniref:TNF receptor-associated factor 6-like n=1 Tax=Dermacentor albipictus TaxID=60249 RepID=UPI0031FD369E